MVLLALFVSLVASNNGYRVILYGAWYNFSLGLIMSKCSTAKYSKQPQLPKIRSLASILCIAIFTMPIAQAASCKLPKSYYKNVSCTTSRGHFLAITDFGAPVALIDSRGKRVTDLSDYQSADGNKIAGGLIPVQRNGRVGYVNLQGREVIPAIYDRLRESEGWARPVSEGRIVVKSNGQYGVISTTNQTVVPFSSTFSDIDNYRSGIARVSKNRVISWLDKSGKTTADPDARTTVKTSSSNTVNTDSAIPPRSQLPNRFTTLQAQQQDGKWGFVDEQDVLMITYSFDEVRPFSEGLAGVRIDDNWGFVNLGGELVIPLNFDNNVIDTDSRYRDVTAFVFKEGKAWVGNLKNGDKVCIGTESNIVSCE